LALRMMHPRLSKNIDLCCSNPLSKSLKAISLSAVPGLFAKLRNVAMLHGGRGTYSHWGLARVHGREAAQCALRTSHETLLAQVLKAPLRVLEEDLSSSACNAWVTALEYLSSLESLRQNAPPGLFLSASQKHFRLLPHGLSALAKN
jgi:hypothetical protein